jgi:SAM-dependent methyltransferase
MAMLPQVSEMQDYEYSSDLEWTICPICGGWETDFLFSIRYDYTITVERCKNCGMVFINPKHSWQWLLEHYPVYRPKDRTAILEPSYFTAFATRNGSRFSPVEILWRVWARYIDLFALPLARDLPQGKSRVFDYVCRDGTFLRALKEKAGCSECELYGTETRPSFIEYATENGVKVFHGLLEDAGYPDEFFDVVYMRHMIEHLFNPRRALQEVHRTMKQGGLLRIETPNMASLSAKIYGRYWYGFWPLPRHIHMFSPRTLTGLLQEEGFRVERVCCSPGNAYLYHSLIPMFKEKGWTKLANRLEKKYTKALIMPAMVPLSSLAALLKVGDEMIVLCRKEGDNC